MKPSTKERLIWSPVGGLAIPTAYFLLLNLLDHAFYSTITPALKWLTMPLIWPAYIYDFLIPRPVEPVSFEMPGPGFWLYLAVANFLFYSLLTYLLIRRKQGMPRLR
jgi:hypothetical protein